MKFGINFFPAFRPNQKTTADYYAQCLRVSERADALGFSSIKAVEHYFHDYGGHSPNPIVLLSAIASRTKRLRPITGAVIPAFNHPIKFPDAVFGLSNWGPFFDDILTNPSHYGITNTTDPCFSFATGTACSDPDKHFYYFIVHPSDVAHHIVGNELFTEVLALPSPVPEPATWGMMLLGFVGLGFAFRRSRRKVSFA
jgi:hypothetical protein